MEKVVKWLCNLFKSKEMTKCYTCLTCRGSGRVQITICLSCGGTGLYYLTDTEYQALTKKETNDTEI